MAKRKVSPQKIKEEKKPAPDQEQDDTTKKSLRAGFDFIAVLVGAVIIAIAIKTFLLDVYLIPSGSMETALHGRPDGGDRIFCSKVHYYFRDIKRWEVAVFEFPYEAARVNDSLRSTEAYRNQNFVKRIVGLPGEHLAIARGDIWTKPIASGGEYVRQVKPDHMQRDMWLNVYEQNFADISLDEFSFFWKISNPSQFELERRRPLRFTPSADGTPATLAYRPRVPAGAKKDSMPELPGIPDRYTLRQPVQFQCNNNVGVNDDRCGHIFVQTFQTQNMQARCPLCGNLEAETSAVYYHRRSGLPNVGPYAVEPIAALQGEDAMPRDIDYHIVPDLRSVADITLEDEKSWYAVTLSEDRRRVQAVFNADGVVELRINGAASRPEHRAIAPIRLGRKHTIEFYIIDGTARIFVDSSTSPLLDIPVWNDKRPLPTSLPTSSGVELAFGGGAAVVSNLKIDRDIFYYSSWERKTRYPFLFMSPRGEALINDDSFFPMGDHCPSSYDARSWGPVPLSNLLGPALFIWWPPERIKTIATP